MKEEEYQLFNYKYHGLSMTMSSSKSLHTLLPFNMTLVMYVHKYDNVYLLYIRLSMNLKFTVQLVNASCQHARLYNVMPMHNKCLVFCNVFHCCCYSIHKIQKHLIMCLYVS